MLFLSSCSAYSSYLLQYSSAKTHFLQLILLLIVPNLTWNDLRIASSRLAFQWSRTHDFFGEAVTLTLTPTLLSHPILSQVSFCELKVESYY